MKLQIVYSPLVALAFGLLSSPPPAYAWSSVGAGCVPTGQTSQLGVHFNTAGRTKFSAGKVGEIILTCPVTGDVMNANLLSLSYLDADGMGTAAQIVATLRRMDRSTGSVASIRTLDSNLDSSVSFGEISAKIDSAGCGHYAFDHNRYYYYVQVNMLRSSLSLDVSFGGVAIGSAVC